METGKTAGKCRTLKGNMKPKKDEVVVLVYDDEESKTLLARIAVTEANVE
jgi:hypothetical protein